MAALVRMGKLIVRWVVPVVLRIAKMAVFVVLTYWASLSDGLPRAARIMTERWSKGLPVEIAASSWGGRISALYTLLAWTSLMLCMVLQSYLIAWLLSLLLTM